MRLWLKVSQLHKGELAIPYLRFRHSAISMAIDEHAQVGRALRAIRWGPTRGVWGAHYVCYLIGR